MFLSAIFAEECYQRRMARVKFIIGTTLYDWSNKNIGTQMHNECSCSGLEQWSRDAGSPKSCGVKLTTFKGGTTVYVKIIAKGFSDDQLAI
jgi:hypothetical protein